MLRVLNIGPLALQTSLLVLIVGYYLSLELINRYASRKQLEGNKIQNTLLIALGVGLVGARLVYVGFNWDVYQDSLSSVFSLTPQGLHTLGGIVTAAIYIVVDFRWSKVPLRPALDGLAPGVALIFIAMNLAFLAEGDFFGIPTDLPWAIDLWRADRHPTQLYALLGALITLGCWYWWQKNVQSSHAGQGLMIIFFGNALSWLVASLWLDNPTLVLDAYRFEQLLAWAGLMIAAFLFDWFSHHPDKQPQPASITTTE